MSRTLWRLTLCALAVLVLGALGHYVWSKSVSKHAADKLFALTLPDSEMRPVSLAQWRGKVLVVNFWGTWCPPCRREMPVLDAASQKYHERGVRFVGIASDTPETIGRFRAENPLFHYPLLAGDRESFALMKELGNKASVLPFSIVIDQDGHIRHRHTGELKAEALERVLAKSID